MKSASPPTLPPLGTDPLGAGLERARSWTLALVASVSDENLERVHTPLMSPLVWDLGHIAAYEDLWLCHRVGGLPLLREDLTDIYDAFETPRATRGDVPFLRRADAESYLEEVRERTLTLLEERGPDPLLHEMVLRHEQQHTETMLQTVGLAKLESYAPPCPKHDSVQSGDACSGLEMIDVPAASVTIGAVGGRFAYDNEGPRHERRIDAFRIGRTALTNADWLSFWEGGGYERREWWTDEAWAWKQEYDICRPLGWTDDGREWRLGQLRELDERCIAIHVSWFEADAFARAHDARLPTEFEWERAATWDQDSGAARAFPWGEQSPSARLADLDQRGDGPDLAGSYPDGASPCGALDMLGGVWEWTSSEFGGYAGFEAFPYREYSEVFFGSRYRVLRGGSWATQARVATPSFRNWDLPERRQIFAGVRLAKDVA